MLEARQGNSGVLSAEGDAVVSSLALTFDVDKGADKVLTLGYP